MKTATPWKKSPLSFPASTLFAKKEEFLQWSLKTMCEQLFLKQLQMMCKRTFTKFTFLSNRIYSLRTLLTFWIFLDKIKVFRSFFLSKLNYLSTFQFQVGSTYGRKMMNYHWLFSPKTWCCSSREQKGWKGISRSLLATPRSEKIKYCQVFKPDPLPRRLF